MNSFLEESPLHVVAGSPVFERLNFADELPHVVELAVDRDIAHVGDGIDLVKLVHHLGSDDMRGNLGDMILVEIDGEVGDDSAEVAGSWRYERGC